MSTLCRFVRLDIRLVISFIMTMYGIMSYSLLTGIPNLVAFYVKLNEIKKNEFHFALEVSFSIFDFSSSYFSTTATFMLLMGGCCREVALCQNTAGARPVLCPACTGTFVSVFRVRIKVSKMSITIGTPKIINFPFVPNGKLMIFRCSYTLALEGSFVG